jgi:tetratricopeptide (TPR) repeat protein
MLNIVPFRSMMQDRFMYLPILGPIALAASWLDARVLAPGARRVAAAAAIVLVGIYAALTARQVEMWSSDFTLWQGEARTAAFLAVDPVYEPPDRTQKLAFLQAAVEEDPSSPWLQNNLASMAFAAGRNDEALPGFERAAALSSDNAEVLINLGRAYARAGRPAEALRTLERAALLAPHSVHAHLGLARLHLAQGNPAGARRELEICRYLVPGDTAARAWAREWAELARLEAGAAR